MATPETSTVAPPLLRLLDEGTSRALLQSGAAILWATDPAGACTFLSDRWHTDTGQSRDAALRFGWMDALHPEDQAHASAIFQEAHQRREPFVVDYRLRQCDGTYRWVLVSGQPRLDPGGESQGFVGAILDIDDRKRAELALRDAQHAARFLGNVGVALGAISDSQSALGKLASLTVPFLADWCSVDLVQDDGRLERLLVVHSEPRKAALAHEVTRRWLPDPSDLRGPGRVAATGTAEICERVLDADKVPWVRGPEHLGVLLELGFASYLCVPLCWQGRIRAALTLCRGQPDRSYVASDLRVAEELAFRSSVAIENTELYRGALEADRRKDEFLAVLSHELRTPLNAIVGWSYVLRERAANPETLKRALDTIHRNALVQTQLIGDILDVSRIVAGKLRLEVRPVDLAVVIEAALNTLSPAARARGVQVETLLEPGAGFVSGDASRLQQIVSNLLSNAIKFVPEQTGRVRVRLAAVGSHARLSVEDNGPGLDPSFLPHAFERFRQAESPSNRTHQGLGLGLAIVRHLLELHGGSVRVENRPERAGAVFTVALPRLSAATAPAPAETVEPQTPAGPPPWVDPTPSLAGIRILVVDDHRDARELLSLVLEGCGAIVTLAASAAEGLALLSIDKPDVVVADIEMPEQSGHDFLRKLRSLSAVEGGQTPAIALTAYATSQDRAKALGAGFQKHVAKPVQPAELAALVASLVRDAKAEPGLLGGS